MPRKAEYDRIKADPVRYAEMLRKKAAYRHAHSDMERERDHRRRRGPCTPAKGCAQYFREWRKRNGERLKERAQQPHAREKRAAKDRRWRQNNPQKVQLQKVRQRMAMQMGVRYPDVPAILVETKALHLAIRREIRGIPARSRNDRRGEYRDRGA